jgi:uncharacterized protein YciI
MKGDRGGRRIMPASDAKLQDPRRNLRESRMLYAIIGLDRPDSLSARLSVRPAHLERLNALRDAGRIVLAGPFPAIDSPDPGPAGFSGSLIVAEFASLEAARAWADADPYIGAGVYERVDVRPFKQVLP